MSDSLSTAFANGWEDRVLHGLLRVEQLYRNPWSRRAAWRIGWEVANLLTSAPLRTAKKKGKYGDIQPHDDRGR